MGILSGVLRTKVAAILLGPVGVGVIGLLQSLMASASAVSSFGLSTVGTRQIAVAVGSTDTHAVGVARRALFLGTLGLSVLGAVCFWLLREVLAETILGDAGASTSVGWLALGVALTVASGSQGALLSGLRRINELARTSIYSAVLSTLLGVGALWLWGDKGVLAFVLSAPLVSFVLGHWFVSRLPKIDGPPSSLRDLAREWASLARLGGTFMVAGLVVASGQLAVRWMVQRDLGAEALGHFQAAWAISMTYVGLVLQAMGADYYPRLGAAIHDHTLANRMVNEQAEVALLLAGPVFLVMLGLAPWIVGLLYSGEFSGAINVLRWQVLGDILKVVSWPLGFIILAAGDGRTFMTIESLAIAVLTCVTWLGLPLVGINATGIAFVVMYACYLPAVYFLAHRRTGFRWHAGVLKKFSHLCFAAALIFAVAVWSNRAGAALGVLACICFAIYNLGELGQMTELEGSVGLLSNRIRRLQLAFRRGDR